MADLKIGQVATLVGVGIDTVRYYEKLGLLPAAPRRASGYRVFDETTVERIRLVKQLQDIGLSLQEIDAMFRATGEHATCEHESEKIRTALGRTEERIAALTALQVKLRDALRRCSDGECTIMAQLSAVTKKKGPGSGRSKPTRTDFAQARAVHGADGRRRS